ncbi:amidohydrolase family protein [Nocardioides sp. AE5]|uniref:amidohydrolase family protein n=1 Tax=Nocardioides sp. AE5 TaxID=2962573 RepID=UPI00288100B3|nr:amidohydrolase family protein [Nocardioides sp. AE5]MDT0202707.1 amidohydrolase family protein [Nocardioides sp. AE5]
MRLVFRDVEVEGDLVDVAVTGATVTAVETGLPSGDVEIDGRGGALLPGLHDHHVHLLATAAHFASVDCSPEAVPDDAALASALRADTHPDGWVRGVLYHESVAGVLDRHRLDAWVPHRPVRIQHRSGSLWMLNSAAMTHVSGVLDDSGDVERDNDGEPNGRLWRYDARLRDAFPARTPDLAALGTRLRDLGITGVTDATPDLSASSAGLLADAVADGVLDIGVTLMGWDGAPLPGLDIGPRKVLLRDHDLPTWDELAAMVRSAHDSGRPVGVHCVTVESLLLTLTVLEAVGPHPGDRIEHASVVPEDVVPLLARSGVTVVTQPDFLRTRGDDYLREVDRREVTDLYPHHRLLEAGIPTVASSDAPYGALDPWQVIATATTRRSRSGHRVGVDQPISAVEALAGYLSPPRAPGTAPRRVHPGAPADLCLLHLPLAEMLAEPGAQWVAGTMRTGRFRPCAER